MKTENEKLIEAARKALEAWDDPQILVFKLVRLENVFNRLRAALAARTAAQDGPEIEPSNVGSPAPVAAAPDTASFLVGLADAAELAALKHDLERHMAIASEALTESAALKEQLAQARARTGGEETKG